MREIQVAENKTLKLTNVLARLDASELGNLGGLTQMQNFIKSHSAHADRPVVQASRSAPTRSSQICT